MSTMRRWPARWRRLEVPDTSTEFVSSSGDGLALQRRKFLGYRAGEMNIPTGNFTPLRQRLSQRTIAYNTRQPTATPLHRHPITFKDGRSSSSLMTIVCCQILDRDEGRDTSGVALDCNPQILHPMDNTLLMKRSPDRSISPGNA